ncbi:MAG: DUF302 domain-containing protein [Gaiellales bacterium]|nr:MAG: DUF302 domain-containing protein [Gaiellales bacterium]
MAFTTRLDQPYEEAVETVIEELKKEGFGILTRVDVHDALKEKIGVDFRKYTILGACNPPLAHRALSARPEVGLLLPCNVVVEAALDGGTVVRIINPRAMMQFGALGDDVTLREVAEEAAGKLERVVKVFDDAFIAGMD